MNQPPIPEELKGTEKKGLDVVYAAGPDGKVYKIPLSVAEEYVTEEEHPPIPTTKELAAQAEGGADEVEGHHAVLLRSGLFGYHADWLVGPYIWHYDGRCYTGLHRHPWGPGNPLAIDMDD